MGIHDKQRIVVEVVQQIDPQSGEGIIQDKSKFRFTIGLSSLNPDCDGKVFVGEQLEGLVDGQRIYDLAPYLSSSHDRDAHIASVGPAPDVGWELKTGESNYACGGRATAKPHDGRFSTGFEPARKSLEDLGLDRLDQILTSKIEELSLEQRKIMEKTEKK
jgi:hypothetical protein